MLPFAVPVFTKLWHISRTSPLDCSTTSARWLNVPYVTCWSTPKALKMC